MPVISAIMNVKQKRKGMGFMLLTIDVGNTNIVLGIFKEKELLFHWRISTNREQTEDEYGIILKNLFSCSGLNLASIKAIIISTVVPPLVPSLTNMALKYFDLKPLVVGPGLKTGLDIRMENPREVGADRVVNAVAALHLYAPPLIVVDFGTATTFCAISGARKYLGGAIAPGIGISTEGLFRRAAKLPRVEFVRPERVIGRDTVSSMQSGIYFGFVGQVDGIVERMKAELGENPLVVATGGLAQQIASASRTINLVNQFLTLEGLRLIYQYNV